MDNFINTFTVYITFSVPKIFIFRKFKKIILITSIFFGIALTNTVSFYKLYVYVIM